MARPGADQIIELLGLKPLPIEGGWFRATYRPLNPLSPDEARPVASAIYYLVTPDSFSALHRLATDELFHFYLGDSCEMFQINETDVVTRCVLGQNLLDGETVQHLVQAGIWQGTRLVEGGEWALLGTTMTPGYRSDGFEIATPALLDRLSVEDREIVRDLIAKPE